MYLTIVLRKEVPDVARAQELTNIVKLFLAAHPEVTITSQVEHRLEPTTPPPT